MFQRVRDRLPPAPFLLAAGYMALGAAWLGSNPSGAAPDEPSHYLRALGVGRGDLLGEPVGALPAAAAANPAEAVHLARTTRSVLVPAGLAVPLPWFCTAGNDAVSGRCTAATTTNVSPIRQATSEAGSLPFLYLPPGLAMRLAGEAGQALLLARVANAIITYGLLLAAIVLLWDGVSALSLLGLPLAVTPMVLYIGTAIGPSGPEIASAAAFLAFLLRLTRHAPAPGWAWAIGVTAGAVLNLARPLGPFWTLGLLILAASLAGRRTLLAAARGAPRASAAGGGVLLLTAVVSVTWAITVFPPEPHSFSHLAGFLLPSLAAIPGVLAEAIGIFGWLDTKMPTVMYAIWAIALLLLVVPALLRGQLRERRTLDALVLGVGAAIVTVSALLVMPVGFWLEGRHILPVFLAVPLVAGEVLYRNRDRVGTVRLAWLATTSWTLAATVQLAAWYTTAHRYAVGASGSWSPARAAEWTPAGGWAPWLTFAVAGIALLLMAALAPLARAAEARSAG